MLWKWIEKKRRAEKGRTKIQQHYEHKRGKEWLIVRHFFSLVKMHPDCMAYATVNSRSILHWTNVYKRLMSFTHTQTRYLLTIYLCEEEWDVYNINQNEGFFFVGDASVWLFVHFFYFVSFRVRSRFVLFIIIWWSNTIWIYLFILCFSFFDCV